MTIIRNSRRRRPLVLAIALALGAGGAHAATITVTNTGDTDPTDTGTCTLRQAIVSMQSQTLQGSCSYSNADTFGTNDTIVFANTLSGASTTFSLSSSYGQLTVSGVTAGLTIEGSGQTIDAQHASRVLYVESSTLTVSSLTLTGGSTGSFDNGGGVSARYSTVTLTNSTVSGNSANSGGGVYAVHGTLTLTNSTVSGNSARGVYGGGVDAVYGTLTLTNTTVSGNAAIFGGGVDAVHGTLTLTNSILSGNMASSQPDLYSISSSVSATYGLLGTALYTSPYSNSANHNVFSDSPGLGALADNGGPTQTMALLPDSPALGVGNPALAVDPITEAVLNYDQRGPGFPRTLPDGTIDIGAFQHQGTDRIFANGFESGP